MIDVEEQTNYWMSGALDNFETAKILIDRNRYIHGLFFCYLAVEKVIKAHLVKQIKDTLPRSHNLFFLSEKAKLSFTEEEETFLGILMKYQLQGRYPGYQPNLPDKSVVLDYLTKTEKLLSCLKKKL